MGTEMVAFFQQSTCMYVGNDLIIRSALRAWLGLCHWYGTNALGFMLSDFVGYILAILHFLCLLMFFGVNKTSLRRRPTGLKILRFHGNWIHKDCPYPDTVLVFDFSLTNLLRQTHKKMILGMKQDIQLTPSPPLSWLVTIITTFI